MTFGGKIPRNRKTWNRQKYQLSPRPNPQPEEAPSEGWGQEVR